MTMWLYELSISYPSSYRSSGSYAFKMLNNFRRGDCVIFMFISLVTFLRISTEKKSVNIWGWSKETLMTTHGHFFSFLTKLVSFCTLIFAKKMSLKPTNGFLVSKPVVFSKLFSCLNSQWQVNFFFIRPGLCLHKQFFSVFH